MGSSAAATPVPGWTSSTAVLCRRRSARTTSSGRPALCATRSSWTTAVVTSASRAGTRRISCSGSPAAAPGSWSTSGRCAADAERLGRRPRRRRGRGGRRRPSGRGAAVRRARLAEARRAAFVAVRVRAAVTHTIGGLRVDNHARVLDRDVTPSRGCTRRAPTRAGSSPAATGAGSPSALVYGRVAAETALR